MCNCNTICQLRQCNRLLTQLLLTCLEFNGCNNSIPVLAAADSASTAQTGCNCNC